MTHIDTSQKINAITPLCGRVHRNDDYIYCEASQGELRAFPYLKEITCPVCKAIVHKVQSGVVLSYAKLEAASMASPAPADSLFNPEGTR